MISVKLLSTEQDFERLRCSKKLIFYVYAFYQNSENETPQVVLINEKQDSFLVINEPYDHDFWGELDRLSISYDEKYSEELLKYYTQEKKDWRHKNDTYFKFAEIYNPTLSVYSEEYKMVSFNKGCKEQIQSDFALLLESTDKNILICCSAIGANIHIIEDLGKIKGILAEANSYKV